MGWSLGIQVICKIEKLFVYLRKAKFMTVLELLVGKKMMIETDMGPIVELEIKEVKIEHHSVETGPSTSANDWWPPTHEWDTYKVIFTSGKFKEYSSIEEIKFH